MSEVADQSWAHVPSLDLHNAGFVGQIGYVSWEPGKNLRRSEIEAAWALDMGTLPIWESTASRPLGGRAAGLADGAEARRQLDALGYPSGGPVGWAMDADFSKSQFGVIADYARAFKEAVGRPTVGYIGADWIDWALPQGIIDFGWIPGAFSWSHEFWHGPGTLPFSAYASLIQMPGQVMGGKVDRNLTYNNKTDWGQWPRPTTPEDDVSTVADEIVSAISNKLETLGLGQLGLAINSINALKAAEGEKLVKTPEDPKQYKVVFLPEATADAEFGKWRKVWVPGPIKPLLVASDDVEENEDTNYVTLDGDAAATLRRLPEA